MFRKYWLLLVALALIVGVFVLSFTFPDRVGFWDETLQAITVGMGWVLFILQYLYSKSERFYVLANTLRLWLTNETTQWNFTVDLYGCSAEDPLREVWSAVSQQNGQARCWHSDDTSLIVNMPGYTLRVFVAGKPSPLSYDADDLPTVCIQVSNLELPFRSFRKRIENEAMPLIKGVVDVLSPATEKYAVKIGFSSTNPYFGFFVRRLDLPRVVSFTCDLIETSVGGQEQVVTVRKDQVEIVSDNLLALQALSSKYVRLAAG